MSQVLDALYKGDTQRVAELLAQDPALNIFEAAALGRTARLRELLQEDRALANAFAPDGFFPLALAAFFGHPESVDLLLEHGADPHARARNPMQVQALHAALARSQVEIAAALLDRGADPDARQQAGYTPLHAAAQHGHEELIRLLLAHGADPTLQDDNGQTPADLARAGGHAEVVALLTRVRSASERTPG